MKTNDFLYDLPLEFIAQTPVEPRDASKLLILDRNKEKLDHRFFRNIGEYLQPGDVLILNQTRVIPARLYARKIPTGGRVEIFLVRRSIGDNWEVLVGGRGLGVGKTLQVEKGPVIQIIEVLEGSRRKVHFNEPIEPFLKEAGHTPLPPYITIPLDDPERYQTVYAKEPGAVAAPTAGLHFTPELIAQLKLKNIHFAMVTLHVGLDTFAPVYEEDPETHQIHSEWCELTPQVAEEINTVRNNGGRIIAVGTTSVRVLETAARKAEQIGEVMPYCGDTNLFILPGYHYRVVDAMITNFHLPKSTLIMMVSAFAGKERIFSAYHEAMKLGYRFFSFGDAMFIQ